MNVNKAGLDLIKHFESCKLKPYFDSKGVPTIGWGNTRYENGKKVTINDPVITQKRADELFLTIVGKFIGEVKSLLKVELADNQFSALVSFAYNVGSDIDLDTIPEGLGDSTLLKLINKNPQNPKIKDEWLKWNKSGGKVIKGLSRRRASEYHLFKYGELNFYEEVI